METKEEKKKRILATGMSFIYFLIQTLNLIICIQQYSINNKIGYFVLILAIFILDKVMSFFILKKEKFGYEIFILDMLNLGFISIYLKRYPSFYRPMYGAKLFFVIIPTIFVQIIFFFGRDMIDETKEKNIQILMIIVYVFYQLLQIRCFLALRVEYNRTFKQQVQMIIVYTLNIFSNYGIWLVFASHRDSQFQISLLFYGTLLFLLMVGYQSYQLYKLQDSTFLLNFLYNMITSTNYTTEYGYYFHHYNNNFEDLYRERQNDLLIMSLYKSAQLFIYFTLGDVKDFQDKYHILQQASSFMVVITFLDIISNIIQYFFGIRMVFYRIRTSKLTSTKSIAEAIMKVDPSKKFIYINNKEHSKDSSGSLIPSDHNSIQMDVIRSVESSIDYRELKVSSELDNYLAQRFLQRLTVIQQDHGCVLVEYPKLNISSQKFEVNRYVNFAQISSFFCKSDAIPSNTFDIHADWESIFMYRLLTKGLDLNYRNNDETYKYCVEAYLDIYLPMMILYKYYQPYLFQKVHQVVQDIYSDFF
ncbi:transmembrane protein, putative (macronuclear) [Tetrahymena thermophila SB210]|uniref:Transmembrane protein, putative n=1 Tax=Tetrahymena thermophila (strain SB210) TaxID=312017 RepID=I7LWA2_TETTS|nr:transmembrane protein, putative [Tetrahymena thermophila SB210]EAS01248.3 transmembrane protein, putative [Tetrahymena thermophila SB210]|eukprot:XP_001021493.3 transmembrane protein, putative [Tetrahymena thermophila SB210]